jgi:pilus assembly protein CpaB
VTLEVSPDQAEKIDLARSIGTLSLVLRNQVDPQATATAGATRSTLLNVAAPIVPASAPAPVHVVRRVVAHEPSNCVRVIAGSETSKECF